MAGADRDRQGIDTGLPHEIRRLFRIGEQLVVAQLAHCAGTRALGLIRSLDVRGFPLMRSWFLVQRRTAPLLPTQAELRDFLITHGQKIVDQFGANPGHGRDAVTPASNAVAIKGARMR